MLTIAVCGFPSLQVFTNMPQARFGRQAKSFAPVYAEISEDAVYIPKAELQQGDRLSKKMLQRLSAHKDIAFDYFQIKSGLLDEDFDPDALEARQLKAQAKLRGTELEQAKKFARGQWGMAQVEREQEQRAAQRANYVATTDVVRLKYVAPKDPSTGQRRKMVTHVQQTTIA